MALSPDRLGRIAFLVLQRKLEDEGKICLNPKEVKRNVANEAKKYGITPDEAAEFAQLVIKSAYERTMAELGTMISG